MLKGALNFGADARSVLDAIGKALAIIEFDPSGRILTANENFCQALGYELSEIKGKHHSLFVDPDYVKSKDYQDFWAKLGRGEFDAHEYKRIGKGGREVWIQASYNPVLASSGKTRKVVKVATVITAQKLQSAENEGKLAAISRAQAVIEFSPDGRVLTANENFLKVLGYRLDEIVGQHHRMFVDKVYAQAPEYSDFWRKLGAGEYVAEDFKRISKSGAEVWIQASYNPIFDLNGKVSKVVKIAVDLTDRMNALNEIGRGMELLAAGDLKQQIVRTFIPSLEKLRGDFNEAVRTLHDTMVQVGENAHGIAAGSEQIQTASDDLSQRTEQQAASLEETAAAMEQITSTTQDAAKQAGDAGSVVGEVRGKTQQTGEIVKSAVEAMGRIDRSSNEIVSIIGVIDDIAFQTNLLALNAGVEAARAGESGRGFAVVAQEIRSLAQRSAQAAKEIKALINQSIEHVKVGVEFVGRGGEALGDIVDGMARIDVLVSSIVNASKETAQTLHEVNTAVSTLDHGTQQNAAMVEESTAAAHSLSQQAAALVELIAHFRVDMAERDSGRAHRVNRRAA